MAEWADLWYAYPYFVGHFGLDLADKRPVAGVLFAIGRTGLEGEGDVYLAADVSCK